MTVTSAAIGRGPRLMAPRASRPLSIVHVLAPCESGGLENVVRSLAGAQRASGHLVRVIAVTDDRPAPHPFVTALLRDGTDVTAVPVPPRAYLRERAALAALCAQWRPDIVHTHGYRPDVLASGVPRRLGIPTVTTAHGLTGGDWKNQLYETLQRRAWRRFDAAIAVSRPLGSVMRAGGVAAHRVHVVPNAFDSARPILSRQEARRRLHIPAGACRVGWVGRFSAEKGPDVFLDALAALPATITGSMIGTGAGQLSLARRAHALGIADRVTWHGPVDDAGAMLAAFDAVVMSSRTEGTPIVLLEAMHARVPVVTTAVGGIPDVVSHAEALLVPSEQPESLAGAIREVVEHPEAAAARARIAQARLLRELAIEPWVARHDAIYSSVHRSRAAI